MKSAKEHWRSSRGARWRIYTVKGLNQSETPCGLSITTKEQEMGLRDAVSGRA